ncbi:NRDE family protein [Marinobacter pelagius]|uniref:NRDE family protein n=1 Tax=Marinobacter sp. C7 TaxID=2951363 RepID=UPI001EF0EFC8|nr:NRDE family protein [Marinobacter sp. C7]MCG7200971.1 NRDE family protein [Marinobacter sp. C7]
MCLIAFALGQNRHFPLVVAANRDEFFRRPTAPMDWWSTESGEKVLAGRDLQSGGTWLAVTADGRVSAVTNVREGSTEAGRTTRGELPLRALAEPEAELFRALSDDPDRYAGFNLIRLGTPGGWYYSNRDAHPGRSVHRGVYGLSNHLLQTPWPKLLRLRESVGKAVELAGADADTLHQQLITLLQDPTPAPDHLLPDTGVGLTTERFLSSPFIVGDSYGTRATTVVTVTGSGQIHVTEQSWGPMASKGDCRHFHWQR